MNNFTQAFMCDLCEINILGCKSSTSTFQCEGSRCEDAREYINEYIEDNEPYHIKNDKRFEKNLEFTESILTQLDCFTDEDLHIFLTRDMRSDIDFEMFITIIENELSV